MIDLVKSFLIACVLSLFGLGAYAQTGKTVVVIPMAGDDIMPKPFAPLTKHSPPNTDYIITTNTVVDKITGLEWQKMDDNNKYSWENAFGYCSGLGLDSKTGWRLPLIAEQQSIVDYEAFEPAIGIPFQASTQSEDYWSASSYADSSSDAWASDSSDGYISPYGRTTMLYVRCVRSSYPDGPLLQDNGNGTVHDFATGLTWQQSDAHNSSDRSHSGAISYCDGLSLAGGGWRLPEIKELSSIVNLLRISPSIDLRYFPDAISSGDYWSVSIYAGNNSGDVWTVTFNDGVIDIHSAGSPRHTRCVR